MGRQIIRARTSGHQPVLGGHPFQSGGGEGQGLYCGAAVGLLAPRVPELHRPILRRSPKDRAGRQDTSKPGPDRTVAEALRQQEIGPPVPLHPSPYLGTGGQERLAVWAPGQGGHVVDMGCVEDRDDGSAGEAESGTLPTSLSKSDRHVPLHSCVETMGLPRFQSRTLPTTIQEEPRSVRRLGIMRPR